MFLRSALLPCETVLNEQSQPEAKQIVWSLCWRPISLRPNKAWKWRHFQQQCWHKWANLFHIKGGRLHLIVCLGIWRKILLWKWLEKEKTINEHDNYIQSRQKSGSFEVKYSIVWFPRGSLTFLREQEKPLKKLPTTERNYSPKAIHSCLF